MTDFESQYRQGELPWDTGEPSSELVRRLDAGQIPRGGDAVDLGCGTGTQAIYLAGQGFQVVGIDISPTAVEQAKRNAQEAGKDDIRFVAGSVLELQGIGEPFDFIFDRGCYHHIRKENLKLFLATLEVFSRPGTLMLCLAGNANEGTDKGPPRVTEEEIRNELGSLFEILDLREFHFDEVANSDDDYRPLGWSCLMRRAE